MALVEEMGYSTSNGDGDVIMTDWSMSEAEDGELIDEKAELPTASQDGNKLEIRAKRFGIIQKNSNVKCPSADGILQLYRSMGVDQNTRLEALHLFGTDIMKTQDVFAYFENNPPASVEWITDITCNAVWLDENSCALALLSSSVRIKGHNIGDSDNNDSSDSGEEEECVKVEDLRLSLPSGVWRKGHSTQFAPNVFLRFATRFDRRSYRDSLMLNSADVVPATSVVFPDEGDEKIRKSRLGSDNPWSDLARQWGHFEKHSGVREKVGVQDAREVIKKRELREPFLKRDAREILNSEKNFIDKDRKMDKLFGKMHADIEEKRMLEKKSLKRTSKCRIHADTDLRERLSKKRSRLSNETKRPWDRSSEEDLVIQVENKLGEETWVGYESAESSDESSGGDTRSASSDLRNKLSRNSKPFSPRSPLRIEIDNDIYYSGNASDSGSA